MKFRILTWYSFPVLFIALCVHCGGLDLADLGVSTNGLHAEALAEKYNTRGQDYRIRITMRKQMSREERLSWLEKNGEVPEDADDVDWQLAQQTSWWGKPISPKDFWKDRTLWNNRAAQKAAMRHGRSYPPMPYDDEKFSSYSVKDVVGMLAAVDGPGLSLSVNDREHAFWNDFDRTHPMYPEEIEREQLKAAADFLNTSRLANLNSNHTDRYKKTLLNSALESNYPTEAFTEEALRWAYIMTKREEYRVEIAPLSGANQFIFTNWMGRLSVDQKYITEPLTVEQLAAANAWKITYLQRLRREKVDESYISAYLKAWNLSAEAVFTKP